MERLEKTELEFRLFSKLPLNGTQEKNTGPATSSPILSNELYKEDKVGDYLKGISTLCNIIPEETFPIRNTEYPLKNDFSDQVRITYTYDSFGHDKMNLNSTCSTLNNNNVPDMKSRNYNPILASDSLSVKSCEISTEINKKSSEKQLFISLHDYSLSVRDVALASTSYQDIEFIDAEPDTLLNSSLDKSREIQNDEDSIRDIDNKLGVKDLLNSLADSTNSIIDECSVPSVPKITCDSLIVNIQSAHKSDLKRKLSLSLEAKKNKMIKYLRFTTVTFFYFERSQGFSSIPSKGGATLGMSDHHFYITSLSIEEYEHNKCPKYLPRTRSTNIFSSQRVEKPKNIGALSAYQRIQLLESCQIVIDPAEEEECNHIRTSRLAAGCFCRDYCDPDICPCHMDEIKCQVDQPNFPCSCSREHCQNKSGRIEYNNCKVKNHFYKTMRKIKCEGKKETHKKKAK